ncbi:MAG: prepilin-type N-terminal cleavage/methylation domain-containing protein [Phycisphaerales bacterium]
MRRRKLQRSAFSLIELVIVVVIIGIISAIAIPRFSQSSNTAFAAAMLTDWRELQSAGERFSAEHAGLAIGRKDTGGKANAATVIARLASTSDLDGTPNASGLYGPYLSKFPTNRENNLATLRVDGAAPGAGTHGWRLDSATGLFVPDTAKGIIVIHNNAKNLDGIVDVDSLDVGGGKAFLAD